MTAARETIAALLAELAAPVVTYGNDGGGAISPCWSNTRPATADDVAQRLMMLGCRGRQSALTCQTCPLAVYLAAHGLSRPWVSHRGARVDDTAYVPLGSVLERFMNRFDTRAYPELEAT